MLTREQRRDMIDKIRVLPEQLAARVRGLSVEQLTTHFLAHEWTVAQNVHHLGDSHVNIPRRLKPRGLYLLFRRCDPGATQLAG